MKILILFLMINTLFANELDFKFVDKIRKIQEDKNHIKIYFFRKSAIYYLDKKSTKLESYKSIINKGKRVKVHAEEKTKKIILIESVGKS